MKFIDKVTGVEIETSDGSIFDKINKNIGRVRYVEKKADKEEVSVKINKPKKKRE